MKFVIEKISKSSGRLGQLLLHHDSIEAGKIKSFKTPMLMQTTKGGSIPYISADVLGYITKEQQLLQLTLSTMDQMSGALLKWQNGLSAYVGLADHPNVLLIRDPCDTTPTGGNDRDVMPLFTRRGKTALSPQQYMELVSAFAPDMYQGPCDADTNADSSKKRVQKSVDRTERFMEYCYKQHTKMERLAKSTLLAPIVGGYNTYARSQSIKHAREQTSDSYGGYVLEGFHTNGLSASTLDATLLLPIVTHCINELDDHKPRMMPGAYTPLVMLELIRLGVDIFDTSYAYCAAVNYKALTFSYEKAKTDEGTVHTPFLDLTDEKLKEQFLPMLSGCNCLACTKHTRAYIHHLYKTNELLGPILLMIHNLHHYMQMFDTIRASIASETLPDLIEWITYQNGDTVVDYKIIENNKVISKAGMGKEFVSATV